MKYKIGWAYRTKIDGEPHEVTLISKRGFLGHVLVRNESISMELDGTSTNRVKMYHQAVPIADVCVFSLRPIRNNKK